jgi:hypothetical protein
VIEDDDDRMQAFTDDDYDDEDGEPRDPMGSWWPVGVAFAITCWAILIALFVRWS